MKYWNHSTYNKRNELHCDGLFVRVKQLIYWLQLFKINAPANRKCLEPSLDGESLCRFNKYFRLRNEFFCIIQTYVRDSPRVNMALTPNQVAQLLKLRALGWSQSEIAEILNTSQQVIGYQLKKLKEQSKKKGTDEVFNAALMGGLAGAAAGIGIVALLELLKDAKK